MLAAALLATVALAPHPPAVPTLRQIAAGFDEPVYVSGVPGRPRTLAVVERYGRIRLLRPGRPRRTLLDLRRQVRIEDPRVRVDQRGLLSIAFAPDYARSGLLYVDYVDGQGTLRVDEWQRDSRTLRHVLDLGYATTQHHGGQLEFGPDGRLYVSTGMGDRPAASQDLSVPGGKILRLDPRAAAPRPEVVALGLRNPWRFSFAGRALLVGDVGDSDSEEVDVVPAGAAPGANFGWPFREGNRTRLPGAPPGLRAPALVHHHAPGWCAVVGGYVLRARYVYGDLCSGHLWSARWHRGRLTDDRRLPLSVPYLVSFGKDLRGRLYAVSFFGSLWALR